MPNAETPAPFPSLPTPTPSKSYEDIANKTVPLPDSSYRPTTREAADAEVPQPPAVDVTGGDNAFPSEATMRDALQALPALDLTDLQIDVEGGSATLHGSVARSSDRDRIVTALGKVPGVAAIIDRLRIRLE